MLSFVFGVIIGGGLVGVVASLWRKTQPVTASGIATELETDVSKLFVKPVANTTPIV